MWQEQSAGWTQPNMNPVNVTPMYRMFDATSHDKFGFEAAKGRAAMRVLPLHTHLAVASLGC